MRMVALAKELCDRGRSHQRLHTVHNTQFHSRAPPARPLNGTHTIVRQSKLYSTVELQELARDQATDLTHLVQIEGKGVPNPQNVLRHRRYRTHFLRHW